MKSQTYYARETHAQGYGKSGYSVFGAVTIELVDAATLKEMSKGGGGKDNVIKFGEDYVEVKVLFPDFSVRSVRCF